MLLYKLFCNNMNDIKKVILDEDIFGVVKHITVVFNDDSTKDFKGSDDKFISLFYDLQENKANLLKRKISFNRDNIDYIEILKRDSDFSPNKINVCLDSKKMEIDNKFRSIIERIAHPDSDLDNYVISTFKERYDTDQSTLRSKAIKDNIVREEIIKSNNNYIDINRPFSALYFNIKDSNKTGAKKIDDLYNNHIYSSVGYKSIDIVAIEEGIPSRIMVNYSDGSTVFVKDVNTCALFIKEAKLRGLTNIMYYPDKTDPIEIEIGNFIKEDSKKSLVKRLFKR